MSTEPAQRVTASLNRLAKWRSRFAGWHLGTRPDTDGPTRAFRDLHEARLLQRAELSAMSRLLQEKGVYTLDEWLSAVATEADALNELLSDRFPGVRATDNGLRLTPGIAATTMRREGFPP